MINNFDIFPREFKDGEFYFIQLIKRSKDNPWVRWINGNNHARCIKTYSIYTKEDLEKRKQEMIDIATVCNARIYIHPARRNKEEIWKLMALLIWEHIYTWKHWLSWLYNHACWLSKWVERLWVVDLDWDVDKNWISNAIDLFRPTGFKVLYELPTKNGYHLITKPFDLESFKKIYKGIDTHKNNPTILFIP